MASLCESCLITGANRGIGFEFVKQIANLPKAPTHIFAGCRNPDSAKDLQEFAKSKTSVHVIKLDVLDDKQISEAVKHIDSVVGKKGLNFILNNAGILDWSQTLPNVTRQAMMDSYNINSVSPLMIAQAFQPLLKKAAAANSESALGVSRAAIVNMSTGAASITDNGSGGKMAGYAYRGSKSALNMISRCIGLDMKEDGIISMAILPGYVSTDMTGNKGNLDVQTSVGKMMEVISNIGEKHNGEFYSYKGEKYPW